MMSAMDDILLTDTEEYLALISALRDSMRTGGANVGGPEMTRQMLHRMFDVLTECEIEGSTDDGTTARVWGQYVGPHPDDDDDDNDEVNIAVPFCVTVRLL